MKYLMIVVALILTIGCHRYSDIDYATKGCDINWKGKCYFKKRIAVKEYDEDTHVNVYTGQDECRLITPDLGCISSLDYLFQIRIHHWTVFSDKF